MSNIRWPQFLNAQASKPLAHVDANLDGFTQDETAQKPTGEGVASTIGINDVLWVHFADREG